jgi:hypothetical protein
LKEATGDLIWDAEERRNAGVGRPLPESFIDDGARAIGRRSRDDAPVCNGNP